MLIPQLKCEVKGFREEDSKNGQDRGFHWQEGSNSFMNLLSQDLVKKEDLHGIVCNPFLKARFMKIFLDFLLKTSKLLLK